MYEQDWQTIKGILYPPGADSGANQENIRERWSKFEIDQVSKENIEEANRILKNYSPQNLINNQDGALPLFFWCSVVIKQKLDKH